MRHDEMSKLAQKLRETYYGTTPFQNDNLDADVWEAQATYVRDLVELSATRATTEAYREDLEEKKAVYNAAMSVLPKEETEPLQTIQDEMPTPSSLIDKHQNKQPARTTEEKARMNVASMFGDAIGKQMPPPLDAKTAAVVGYMRDRSALVEELVEKRTHPMWRGLSEFEANAKQQIAEIDRKVFLLLGLEGKERP